MIRIWKLLVLAGMLVWTATSIQTASAETGAAPGNAPVMYRVPEAQGKGPMNRSIEVMTQRLGLSTEQQDAIKPILEIVAAKRNALRADVKLSAAEKKAKFQEFRADTDDKIRAILTPEQQKKQGAFLKEASERRKIRADK
jgi:protein CpxP